MMTCGIQMTKDKKKLSFNKKIISWDIKVIEVEETPVAYM